MSHRVLLASVAQRQPAKRRPALVAAAGVLTVSMLVMPGPAFAAGDSMAEGDQLYVTNGALDQDPGDPNVARFTLDAAGLPAPAGAVDTGLDAHGIVFTPKPDSVGRRYAYIAATAGDDDEFGSIDQYDVAANGALTFLGRVRTPQPFGIAISPNGRTVYVSHFADDGDLDADGHSSLSAFRVGAGGVLTRLNTKDSGVANPKGVAVTPDGKFVYVSHGAPPDTDPGVLVGFATGSDGSVQGKVAQKDVGATGHRVVITPDGRFVYVTGQDADDGVPDVFGFRIGSYGGLTPVPGTSFDAGTWVEGAAISPDGKRLYVTALDGDGGPEPNGEVRGFAIGADGRLTPIASTDDAGVDPTDLAFGLDGRHLYVSDFAESKVMVFSVDGAGGLNRVQTVDSQGQNPGFQSVAVRPKIGVE